MIKGTTCLVCGLALHANSHRKISEEMRKHLQLTHPKQWDEFRKQELDIQASTISERTKLRQRAQELFDNPDFLVLE